MSSRYGPIAAQSATGPSRSSARAARAAASASRHAGSSAATPRRGALTPAVAPEPGGRSRRPAAARAGSSPSMPRSRTSAARAVLRGRRRAPARRRAARTGRHLRPPADVRAASGAVVPGDDRDHRQRAGPAAPSASRSSAGGLLRASRRSSPPSSSRSSSPVRASARASAASSAPIRDATVIADASRGVGAGRSRRRRSARCSRRPRRRTARAGRCGRARRRPAGSGAMRTGPVARVMPKLSNHARTSAVEPRRRMERVRTGSRAGSTPSPSLSWAPKAISAEVAALQRRGRAEQRGDLVDQLLVVLAHALSAASAPFRPPVPRPHHSRTDV